MAEDIRKFFSGKNINALEILEQKEKDVNRLTNLIFKTLKKSFNPNDREILKLDFEDIFYYWEMTLFIEKIADQLKLLPKHIKSPVHQDCVDIFNVAMQQYMNAMKSNFTKNYDIAINVLTQKKIVYNNAEKLVDKLPHGKDYSSVLEKIKNINDYSGNISKSLLRLKLESTKD